MQETLNKEKLTKLARVGAIHSTDQDTANFFGYGWYVGDFVPPEYVGGFNFGLTNPKIVLDNGDVIWGCECWWANIDRVNAMLAGKKVINISISTIRDKVEKSKIEGNIKLKNLGELLEFKLMVDKDLIILTNNKLNIRVTSPDLSEALVELKKRLDELKL